MASNDAQSPAPSDVTTPRRGRRLIAVLAGSALLVTGGGALGAVCGNHSMPNAEVVVRNFWSGPGRAYLVDFFEVADPCAPPAAL